jgi:hypothetical protein
MRFARTLISALVTALFAGSAYAQSTLPWQTFPSTITANTVAPSTVMGFVNGSNQFVPASATNPMPVNASVSASISGFRPTAYGTPFTATTGGVTGTLPAGSVVVAFNTGTTNTAYCALGGTATLSDVAIPPASWFAFTISGDTQLSCITSTSTTAINTAGGSGLPTGAGGGGGGAGGSSSITTWAGGTLGAMANYGTSPGAVLVPGMNAFVTNTAAMNQTQLNGVALGSPSNYGTSPGAVAVQGVNAFVTNTPAVTQSGTWNIATVTAVTAITNALPAGGNNIGSVNQGTSPWIVSGSGTAGTPAAGVVTVQGITSMTPVQVSQATAANLNATVVGTGTFAVQASESGTWTVQPGNTPNSTAWLVTGTGGTFPATQSGNWTSRIVGNTGGVLDAAGQNAASPAAALVVAAQFNTSPTTITSGNVSPLQLDNAGNLLVNIKAGAAAGGTSSNFAAAFPSAGTAVGMSQGGNMVALTGTSNNLNVQCANCSGSGVSTVDEAAFTAGASLFAAGGGFFQTTATNNALTTGQQGMFQVTANRAIFSNLRNAAGTEVGTAATPLQVSLANTAANGTAVLVTGTGGTFPVSQTTAANLNAAVVLNSTPSLANGNGVVPTQGGAVLSATNGMYTNVLQGNAVLSTGNPLFTQLTTGAAVIGAVTQSAGPWTINWTQLNGVALGSPSNYGTSPGAVSVQGVNAFITNVPAVSQSGNWTARVVGNGGGVFDAATSSAVPANAIQVGMAQSGNLVALTGTAGSLNINCTGGCSGTGGSSQVDEATFTQGSTNFTAVGGIYSTGIANLTTGQAGVVQLTNDRNMYTNINKVANTTLGAPSAYGTSPGAVNVIGVNAFITNVNANGQNTMTNSSPVTMASNQSNINVAGGTAASTTLQAAVTANGNGTSMTVTNFNTVLVNVNCSVACSGGTTINFEGTDSTGTFFSLGAVPAVGGAAVSTATTTGQFFVPVNSLTTLRARVSGYSAGTITVTGTPFYGTYAPLPVSAAGGTSSAFGAAFPANGTAIGLTTGTNMVAWSAASNYGTSPGAIAVPAVNAFITNAPNVTNTGTFAVQATLQASSATAIGTVNPTTAANWGIGATGAAVPANAVYLGINSAGNLTGWNGAVTNGGTFAVQASQVSGPWTQNITQIGGNAIVTGGTNGSQGVGGLAATGAVPAGNPVLVGGFDGTNVRDLSTDTSGRLIVEPGNTANTTAWLVTGTGGTFPIVTWAGGTLGAMANYGTSPGAVLVPGVNAFVTNTVATNTSQVNGVTTLTGAGATGTGAQRVTVSQDTTTIAGSALTATSTTMQNGATANGNGTSLTVTNFNTALVNVNCSVACSGGTTVNFEGTDSTGTFFSVGAVPVIGGAAVSTATTTGQFFVPVNGLTSLRARISAYSAGTITVTGTSFYGTYAALPLSAAGGTSSAFGSAFPANGTAIGLTTGTNMVAWSASSNYGTSPGAIAAPAVNAFVTNTNANVTSASDAVATSATWGSPVVSENYVYNGTTWDRMRSVGSNGGLLVGGSGTAGTAATNVLTVQGIAAMTPVIVNNAVSTIGGQTTAGAMVPNNTTAVVVKGSAGTLYGIQVYGISATPAYVKFYNATSATCGSGTPVKRLMIPAASTAALGAGSNITFGVQGVAFGTGITYCVTTGITDADTTAPAANTFLVNVDYD